MCEWAVARGVTALFVPGTAATNLSTVDRLGRGSIAGVTTIGLVSPGFMGAGLGTALRDGGARVVATLTGRSPRTSRLATAAGLDVLPDLDTVVAAADVVLVVTPPGDALAAAGDIAGAARRTGAAPLVADLNAVSPPTVEKIAAVLATAGLELVDGSISGPPPTARPGARVYLSGERAAEVAALPWRDVTVHVVSERAGDASALKMCTASVYKGTTALYAQALLTAAHYGVLDGVVADLASNGRTPVPDIIRAATKAHRFVPEMEEISATQGAAGQPPELFAAIAEIYRDMSGGELADADPETVDASLPAAQMVMRLRRRS